MQLDCFPPLTVIHTDPIVVGRVYIPLVNWYISQATSVDVGY